MGQKEYRELSCGEAGADCDFLIRAETEEEVMSLASQHACRVHNFCEDTPELKRMMHDSIKKIWCDGECHSTPELKMKWGIPTLG
jgi:predicted small metal-binding protein